ncbi:transposase [Corallococcus sp. AB011P]|uniref:transposase n=1 Tax=Corallococcus sp. AB011P TaxID=2316735 RepID=UPI0018F39D32
MARAFVFAPFVFVDTSPPLAQTLRAFRHAAYCKRCRVECFFNRLKQSRRVATRYEKRAANSLAMALIASIRLWL